LNLREQTPDLGRCWVRYAYRPWSGSRNLWLDLFSRGLGKGPAKGFETTDRLFAQGLDDVVYLPPVEESQERIRGELTKRLSAAGAPVLVQLLPGIAPGYPGAVEIYDVLHAVAIDDLSRLAAVPEGAAVVWPLIGGYSDDRRDWESGLELLAANGVACVQGIAADLSPADRRRVVEVAGEQGFERLFHGPTPSEQEFAGAVHQLGLEPFLARPLPKAPARLRHNRRLAELLTSIGELWLRLGRAESRGQSFFRAARWVDHESHDLVVLARDGNLGVVTWLDEDSREVIEEIAAEDQSTLLAELRGEYLEPTAMPERDPV
jgi:hypothetical protein